MLVIKRCYLSNNLSGAIFTRNIYLQKIPSTKNSSNTHKTSINQLNASTKPSPLPTKENQHKASKYFKCHGFGHIALNSPT
jgi:hypothetical protein